MNNQPNIFNYATSELSQDAFIAWLVEWADKKYKPENEALHHLGLSFLSSLVEKQNIALSEISNLKIRTQYHKIDVFVSFEMKGKTYGIIIEDKVFTNHHSNQLTKYRKFIERQNYDVVVPIYFKTGFQHCYKDVMDKGYYPYTVKNFIEILKKGITAGIDNAIFVNYFEYISERAKWFDGAKYSFENYESLPISEWNWWSCSGFFNDHSVLFNGNWGPVGNRREPLLAFYFGSKNLHVTTEKGSVSVMPYIDMTYSNNTIRVNFRIGLNNNPQTNKKLRDKIFNAFQPYLDKARIQYKKPAFRKASKTMLLAQIININLSINHHELKELLLKYRQILIEFVDDYNKREDRSIGLDSTNEEQNAISNPN